MISIDLQLESSKDGSKKIVLNEVIKHIFKSKKTTVLTGAGISCNAGIPDFRSADGLYNMVKTKFPDMKTIVKGQDLFDISLFRNDQSLSLFCTFMESLYTSTKSAKPTETHKFIKILKDRNKLLRCYTQNIDCLESHINLNVGINLNDFNQNQNFSQNWKGLDVIQLHGNLHKLSCTQCFANFNWTVEYQKMLGQGLNPQCSNCYAKYEERLYSGKRLTGHIGLLRPDIVLYGENHPQSEILAQGLNSDLKSKPDLLIIMGTSLKVDGVKKLVKSLATSIHAKGGKVIFVNKTSLSKQWENYIDYEILCDCDQFINIMKIEVPDLFLTQEQLDSKKLKNNFNQNMAKGIDCTKDMELEKILKSMIKNEIKRDEEDIETDVDEMAGNIEIKQENGEVKFEPNSKQVNRKTVKAKPNKLKKVKAEPKSNKTPKVKLEPKSNKLTKSKVESKSAVKIEYGNVVTKLEKDAKVPLETNSDLKSEEIVKVPDFNINLKAIPISEIRMTRSKSVSPTPNISSSTTNNLEIKPNPTESIAANPQPIEDSKFKDTITINQGQSSTILTPPTTPKKHKRPILIRNPKRVRSEVCDLPSPASSFTDADEAIHNIKEDQSQQLPLVSLTGSQLNTIRIPKKTRNSDQATQDDLYSRKRIKS